MKFKYGKTLNGDDDWVVAQLLIIEFRPLLSVRPYAKAAFGKEVDVAPDTITDPRNVADKLHPQGKRVVLIHVPAGRDDDDLWDWEEDDFPVIIDHTRNKDDH